MVSVVAATPLNKKVEDGGSMIIEGRALADGGVKGIACKRNIFCDACRTSA